ncbi:MAG: hypothetical protein QXP36_11985, partial [Conexivisphaerales archaeon]
GLSLYDNVLMPNDVSEFSEFTKRVYIRAFNITLPTKQAIGSYIVLPLLMWQYIIPYLSITRSHQSIKDKLIDML